MGTYLRKSYFISLFSLVCLSEGLCQTILRQPFDEAESYYRQGNYEASLQILNTLTAQKVSGEILDLKARLEMLLEKNSEAISTLSTLMQLSPERADIYFLRGKLLYDQGLFESAVLDFSQFLQLPSTETTSVFFQVDPLGQDETRIKTSNMLKSEALVYRALCHQQLEDFELSENDMLSAIKEDSTADKYVNLSLIKLAQNDTLACKHYLMDAIDIDSTYALAWYHLLLIGSDVNVPKQVMNDDSFLPLLKYRTIEAIQEGDFRLGQNLINQMLILAPLDGEALKMAGDFYYQTKEYTSALDYYKAAQTKVDSKDLHLNIANCYFRLGSYDAAVSHYELFLVSEFSHPEVWFNAAVAYHRAGDLTNACRCIKRVFLFKWEHPELDRFKRLCD